jgi:16S rRNA (guanine527-N7)-methyltransferase
MAHKNKTNISPYKTRQQSRNKAAASTNPAPVKPEALKGRHKRPDEIYSLSEATDRLADIFRNHDFAGLDYPTIQKLAHFYRLLMLNQEKENFTRLLKLRDIALKHYVDCLIIPRLTELQFPLLDMGTGPGFPGIPLKFLYPDQQILLGEGVQRRVEFLKHVRQEMALKKLDIIGRNINPYCAYPVQGVITRAVEDIRNTLTNVLTSLQTGGKVYLMKGPGVDPEIPVAEKEMGEFYSLEQDVAYTLPHTEQKRRLLVYKKIKMATLPDFDEEPWPGGEEN